MASRLTDIRDAAGKTIAKATYDNQDDWIAILFTDGDYIVIDIIGDDGFFQFGQPLSYNKKCAVDLITQEQMDRMKAAEEARQEDKERQEYERLKAKFEPGGPR